MQEARDLGATTRELKFDHGRKFLVLQKNEEGDHGHVDGHDEGHDGGHDDGHGDGHGDGIDGHDGHEPEAVEAMDMEIPEKSHGS